VPGRRQDFRHRIVAFDGNYRPRLWPSRDEALATRDAAIAVADIGLPTLEDEAALSNTSDTDDVAADWLRLGCRETVIKLGARGALLPDGRIVAPERALSPIDTSGAGDAFNAGYLAARLSGSSIEESAKAGHALAGWTIMRPGAIPPCES
jgi:2-dehydro-3-deoxygluconokinase